MLRNLCEPYVMSRALVAVGLGLLLSTAAACAPALRYFTPPPSTSTLTPGWERWFTLDWTITPEENGSRRLEGSVSSQRGEYAQSVRVLARAVDSQGRVLGEEMGWVPANRRLPPRFFCDRATACGRPLCRQRVGLASSGNRVLSHLSPTIRPAGGSLPFFSRPRGVRRPRWRLPLRRSGRGSHLSVLTFGGHLARASS
jgi:hypothetical protein